jgi:hypothetical protein
MTAAEFLFLSNPPASGPCAEFAYLRAYVVSCDQIDSDNEDEDVLVRSCTCHDRCFSPSH